MAKQNPLMCSLQQTVGTGNGRELGARTRLYLITSKGMNAVSTVHYLNLAFKYSETKKQFRSVNLS
jgi:hypothetical protein